MQASEGDSLTFRSTHISVLLYCERPEKSIKTSVPKRLGGLVMDSNTSTIKRRTEVIQDGAEQETEKEECLCRV